MLLTQSAPLARDIRRLSLGFIICFPLFYGFLSLLVGQDANWDLENYHWYNAYALLNGRESRDILVSQTPSFYNPLLDIPFYLAATHLPAKVVGFLLGWVQGLNGVLLFVLARAVIQRPARERTLLAMAVATAGMIGGGTLGEIGTTFWDNVISLGLLGGLIMLVRYAFDPQRKLVWAGLAGLLMGAAAALKQPQLLYCGGIGLAVLFLPGSFKRRLGVAAWLAAGGLVGVPLTSGFWVVHLWQEYGNPLFPYFNNIFHSPFAAADRDFRDIGFLPHSFLAAVFFPIYITINPYLTGEVAQRGPAILALFLLLPVALLLAWRRQPAIPARLAHPAAARFLLAAMALSYLAWLKMFAIYRYAVPLEMLAPLGVLLAIDHWPASHRIKIGALASFLALCAAASHPADWGRSPWGDRYVEITLPPLAPDTMALMAGYEPVGFIATALPPDVPVLRIQSNFMHPDDGPSRFADIMKARIAAHTGPLVLIYLRKDEKDVGQAMADYGLTYNPATCQDVPNSLDDRGVLLCDAFKQQSG